MRTFLTACIAAIAFATFAAVCSADDVARSLRPDGVGRTGGLLVLSGSLHDHSSDSDGDTSSKAVASWLYSHRAALGIDFATLTEHGDFLPFALQAPFAGNVWRKQAKIDRAFTRDGFSMLRGFEYTSDQENHMNVIGSDDFLGGRREGDLSMAALYHWLEPRRNLIAQFNHPGLKGALQWDNLTFVPTIAADVATMEIYGDQGFTDNGLAHSDAGWYWLALVKGWTLGPVMNWDTHHWRAIMRESDAGIASRCGDSRTLPCQRTLVLAADATPQSIMEALQLRRTTATEHPSLWASLRASDGTWQGSTMNDVRDGTTIDVKVEASSSRWPLTSVDIVSDAGVDPHPYYDGDNTSPTRRDEEGSVLVPSYREQHRRFIESAGYTLRKGSIDGPPPSAIVASVALEGHRGVADIHVRVPDEISVRPDHKHFFYAIVHAGPVRAWTAPIFTEDATRYAENERAHLPLP